MNLYCHDKFKSHWFRHNTHLSIIGSSELENFLAVCLPQGREGSAQTHMHPPAAGIATSSLVPLHGCQQIRHHMKSSTVTYYTA
jgi:hypothetical protein